MKNNKGVFMLPRRPYLLQAYFDWMLDSELTPYLMVDATYPFVTVPQEFVNNGQIILNIAPHAVGNFSMGKEKIQFTARFKGTPRQITIPLGAVIGIYARENSEGILFEEEDCYNIDHTDIKVIPSSSDAQSTDQENKDKKSPSHLRIVK